MVTSSSLPPNPLMRAGQDFNYSAWNADTILTACTVPWDANYRDIVDFASRGELDAYLDGRSNKVVFRDTSLARFEYTVRVNQPFSVMSHKNYLRAHNPLEVSNFDFPATYYYFIREVKYVAPHTTELMIQLDVWATYKFNISFGRAYVEQGHLGIANSNQFYDYGRHSLTTPEGLDVGNEYTIAQVYQQLIASSDSDTVYVDQDGNPIDRRYDVIVVSTVALDTEFGTVDEPKLYSARGSAFGGLPNGADVYWFPDVGEYRKFMQYVYDKPWISQGIVSVTAVPPINQSVFSEGAAAIQVPFPDDLDHKPVMKKLLSHTIDSEVIKLADNWRDSVDFPARYKNLKKFYTYPYMVVEVTTYSGTALILKPECMSNDDMYFTKYTHVVPPNPRVAFVPNDYNAISSGKRVEWGEFLNMQTGFMNLPTFSVTNNGYMSYMAANAHSIAYQHSSADWSQQKTLRGNTVSQQNAYTQIQNASQQTSIQNDSTRATADMNNTLAKAQAIQGGTNALMSMNPLGMVQGGFNTAANYMSSTYSNDVGSNIAINARSQATTTGNNNQKTVVDSNKAYADFAAQGDYQNAIAGINAKVQDARLIQPTSSGQVGGDAFNLSVNGWWLTAKVKVIQRSLITAIGEYWLRYGYAVNRYHTINNDFNIMEKFTYWKLKDAYVFGGVPETFRQSIRGIFESGVTVWAAPDMIGKTDLADNDVVTRFPL